MTQMRGQGGGAGWWGVWSQNLPPKVKNTAKHEIKLIRIIFCIFTLAAKSNRTWPYENFIQVGSHIRGPVFLTIVHSP